MSRFERIPPEVRQNIFKYLLVSDHVRQPPNHLLIEHYDFQVNVLRLNRAIHKEAAAVFYQDNIFIKVYNYFDDTETSMLNHEVPFFKLKNKFEHHVTEIRVKYDPLNRRMAPQISKKPFSFLILLADIPKLTRVLRVLDLANFMGYQFDFTFHQPRSAPAPLSTKHQTELLYPFERLRGSALIQKVSFSGAFDPSTVKRVTTAMTYKIAWLRAGAWEIHDIALSMKRMGDSAFRLNNADMVLAKYEDARLFMDAAAKSNVMTADLDNKFDLAMFGLEITMHVDIALVMLSDSAIKEAGERQFKAVPLITKHIDAAEKMSAKNQPVVDTSVLARFFHLLGIAELGLDHPVKASKAFAKAYKTVSDQSHQQGHKIAKGWKNSSVSARSASLNALLARMPQEPLPVSGLTEYATPEVASEQWVMRELGYKGPFQYEDKIKSALAIVLTNKPHPNHHNQGPRTAQIGVVKPEVLRKHLQKYRKIKDQPPTKGRFMCWVGLHANEIGEETVLDDPEYIAALRNMTLGGGGGGCATQ